MDTACLCSKVYPVVVLRLRQYAMGNCWAQCCGFFKRETSRIHRGGGSKYFRTNTTGEHFTIEVHPPKYSLFLRPLSEEEIGHLKEKRYNAITENQKTADEKLHSELAAQEEKLRIEEEAFYAAQREAARAAIQSKLLEQHRLHKMKQRPQLAGSGDYQKSLAAGEDFETYLRNVKAQSEAFRSSRATSETNMTPNTESSCDFTSKTRSTNDDTSLDLEWEDEEGMNTMIPVRERSKTEEDLLRAALRPSGRRTGSNPTSTSDDSNGLEWENDFVGTQIDDNGNSEYAGFVNPVLELSSSSSSSDLQKSDSNQQDR
ncbi:AP-1 complex-associated regulatory protein-like isoform X1 [Acipenser oxyrinchus oxyrinchus]|uniref:AP-1 complex-associated regulatory protein-like isoform X1 n=1 Tax=Acipenser oxyrinchus oxyrinchus TaxID=40147 RepID=A0AAD8LUJ6_ACIOX|nr:AP-1 complex-associated regulatory protein-like isoform X1 [Acipenser oxyrinchus oxyrinchus]